MERKGKWSITNRRKCADPSFVNQDRNGMRYHRLRIRVLEVGKDARWQLALFIFQPPIQTYVISREALRYSGSLPLMTSNECPNPAY